MIGLIITFVLGLFFVIMFSFCLKGVDWILISGPNMLPKEDRQKYKDKHDMVALNRFIGKRVFLPSAVSCFAFSAIVSLVTFSDAEWVQSTWFAVIIVIVVIAFFVLVGSALPKIFGNHFEVDKK